MSKIVGGVDRRGFLKGVGVAAAGLATSAALPDEALAAGFSPMNAPGKLVRVSHPAVVKGKIRGRKKLDSKIAADLVHRALTELTGAATPAEAMGRFINKADVVGIKVNTLGSPGSASHPAIAMAIAGLVQEVGVPVDNIIIYDQYGSRMRKAGYKLREKKGEITVIRHWGRSSGKEDPKWGYGPKTMTPAGPTRFCKILDKVTAIIGVPVIKDHDLTGVTGAIKNIAYGHLDVVPKFHCHKGYGWVDGKRIKPAGRCNKAEGGCKFGKCNVARMYSAPELKSKVRVHIADATAVQYHGGPQFNAKWTVPYGSVIASTDPVAMDAVFLRIVDEHRTANKMKPIGEVRRPRTRPATFIQHASDLGLGIADSAKHDYKEISLA